MDLNLGSGIIGGNGMRQLPQLPRDTLCNTRMHELGMVNLQTHAAESTNFSGQCAAGLVLPILGALPDSIIILVAGLHGSKAMAHEQVSPKAAASSSLGYAPFSFYTSRHGSLVHQGHGSSLASLSACYSNLM